MTTRSPRPHDLRRVLVTGAAGEIGTATAQYFADKGVALTGLSLAGPFDPNYDRTVIGDATSPADVADALDGVDAIVHLAALPHPSAGLPYDVYRTNVSATFNVLSQAGEHGIERVVIASSINASGLSFNRHRVMPAYYPLDERIPADIEDAYSLSKLSSEIAARMAARRWDLDVVSIRFPLVKDEPILLEASESAQADPASVVREGWSYLDMRDGVRAIHLAATRPIRGDYVIGLSAEDTLMPQPTEELLALYAPGVPLRRRIHGRGTTIDNDLARTVLGFEPEYSIFDRSAALAGVGADDR